MGLVSRLSLANHSDSESFLAVHALFSQDGCQREGFWGVVGPVESPFDLSHSSGWWCLIRSVFITRTSHHKTTHGNGYYGTWSGWAVLVSVLPLTVAWELVFRSSPISKFQGAGFLIQNAIVFAVNLQACSSTFCHL